MKLQLFPATLKQANEMVERLHRHHKPAIGHRFSIGCEDENGIWIQTSILENETGTSLKAAGWHFDHTIKGRDWNCPSRGGRRTDQPMCDKQVWIKKLK